MLSKAPGLPGATMFRNISFNYYSWLSNQGNNNK